MNKIIAPIETTPAVSCEVQITLGLSSQVELGRIKYIPMGESKPYIGFPVDRHSYVKHAIGSPIRRFFYDDISDEVKNTR
jgi:hypothetical protein